MKIQIYTKKAIEELHKLDEERERKELISYSSKVAAQQVAILKHVIPSYLACLYQAHNHTWDHDLCNSIISILVEMNSPIPNKSIILALKTLISKVNVLASNCDKEYNQVLMLMRSNFVSSLFELDCAMKNMEG